LRRRRDGDAVERRPCMYWGPTLIYINLAPWLSSPNAMPSSLDVQSHLYTSFLHASTYDVALRVSGTWNAIYKLHRVVLIQSVRALCLSIIHLLIPPRDFSVLSLPAASQNLQSN
jgi:hypothetical protein